MLRLFGQIRKQLMEQNKTRTYIIYAIGEIILVMIGILLALQVNNWNEQRKDSFKEQYMLRQLKADFGKSLESVTRTIVANESSVHSGETLIGLLQNGSPAGILQNSVDSLIANIIINYKVFDPANGALDDILNSGTLDLIQNDSLRYELSQWSSYLGDINSDYDIRNTQINSMLTPFLAKNFSLVNMNSYFEDVNLNRAQLNVKKSEFEWDRSILQNPEFESQIFNYMLNQSFVIIEEKRMRRRILDITKYIDQELDS